MPENLGASFNIDVSNLKAGLSQANRLIRESQSEFKAAAAGMDDWRKSQDGLTARIKSLNTQNDLQKKKVEALKEQYRKLESEGLDPTDKQMVELRTKINKETETLNKNEKELEEDTKALKNLSKEEKDAGEEAKKSSEKMKKIGGAAKSASKVALAAFGAVTAAVGKMVKGLSDATSEAADSGDEIDKMSQKLGMTTEGYQKWGFVLSQAGTDINSMTTGMKTLTNQIGQATNGSEKAAANFEKLGISMDDLKGMSREDAFAAVVKGFQDMEDSTERAAIANTLFGKSGQNLTPLFNESAEATEELMNKAEECGMIMKDDAVNAAVEYHDSLDALQHTASTVKNTLVSNLLPGLTQVFDGFSMLISGQEGAEDAIVKGAEDMISSTEKVVPQLMTIVTSVIQSLTKILPKVLTTLVSTLVSLMPSLIKQLTVIFDVLLKAIFNNGAQLAKAATTLVMNLVNLVLVHLTDILQLGIQIILALVDGIVDALPELTPAMIDVVVKLCDALLDNLPTLITAATQIIAALLSGIVKALPKLLKYMPKLIKSMIGAAAKSLGVVLKFGKDMVAKLTAPFSNIPKWFKSKFDDVWKKIKSAFSGVGSFFGGIWKTIKDKFTGIGTKIGDAIGGAFKKAINSVLATAEKAINFLPNSINKMLDVINKLPGVSIGKMSTVSLPRLEHGGLVRDATQALIGERKGHHEAVLPLTDKRAMKEIADAMNAAGGGRNVTINQTNNFSKAHSRREIYESKKATERAIRNELKKVSA